LTECLRLLKPGSSCPATNVLVAPVLVMVSTGVLFVWLWPRLLWWILAIASLLPIACLLPVALVLAVARGLAIARRLLLILTIARLLSIACLLSVALVLAVARGLAVARRLTRILAVARLLPIAPLLTVALVLAVARGLSVARRLTLILAIARWLSVSRRLPATLAVARRLSVALVLAIALLVVLVVGAVWTVGAGVIMSAIVTITRLLAIAMTLLPITWLGSITLLPSIALFIAAVTRLLIIAVTLSVTWLTVSLLLTIGLLIAIILLLTIALFIAVILLLAIALTLLTITWLISIILLLAVTLLAVTLLAVTLLVAICLLLAITVLVAVALLLAIALLVAVTLMRTVAVGLAKPNEVLAVTKDAGPRWTEGSKGPAWGGLVRQPDSKLFLPASVQQKLEFGVQVLCPGHASPIFRVEDALLFDVVILALFAVPRNEADPGDAVCVPGLWDVHATPSKTLGLRQEGHPAKPAAAADSVWADNIVRRQRPLFVVLVRGRLFLLVLQEREDARVVHVRLVRVQVIVQVLVRRVCRVRLVVDNELGRVEAESVLSVRNPTRNGHGGDCHDGDEDWRPQDGRRGRHLGRQRHSSSLRSV